MPNKWKRILRGKTVHGSCLIMSLAILVFGKNLEEIFSSLYNPQETALTFFNGNLVCNFHFSVNFDKFKNVMLETAGRCTFRDIREYSNDGE